jgi:hypothetical protein
MIRNTRQGIIQGFLVMSILAALVAAVLGGLNRIAASLQNVVAVRISDIAEAGRSVGFSRIDIPAYFPEGITWPPSSIIGQKKPFPAVALEFRSAQKGDITLIIVQQAGGSDLRPLQRIALSSIREETPYLVKQRQAVLRVGTCSTGVQCSQMHWTRGDMHHAVLFLGPPIELIRIAESMIH